jgi:hypothetical protein
MAGWRAAGAADAAAAGAAAQREALVRIAASL